MNIIFSERIGYGASFGIIDGLISTIESYFAPTDSLLNFGSNINRIVIAAEICRNNDLNEFMALKEESCFYIKTKTLFMNIIYSHEELHSKSDIEDKKLYFLKSVSSELGNALEALNMEDSFNLNLFLIELRKAFAEFRP